jgi:flagellar hook-length control protein FliK
MISGKTGLDRHGREKNLNNPSPQLQMPSHIDAKPTQAAAPVSTSGDTATQGGDKGFAQALRMLQALAQDGLQVASVHDGKAHKSSSSDSAQKSSGDGKDLPLTAVLLPLLQQIQAATPTRPEGAGASKVGNALTGSEFSKSSLVQLQDMMQLLTGKSGASPDTGELKAWLAALVQAAAAKGGAHSGDSAGLANASITAALAAHGGAGTSATAGSAPAQQQAAAAQAPLTLADPGFANALGERVSWLAGAAGNHAAQLQLNPRELGPMLVHVKVDGHHTQVLFQTQHAVVRDTLEAALPRLREMLGQGGQQVSVNVQHHAGGWSGQSGQGQQQTPQWTPQAVWSGFTPLDGETSDLPTPLARWYGLRNGMVDTYV